jgi:hypothetical protein
MSSTLRALAVGWAATLLVSGCSGDDGGESDARPSTSASPQPPPATSTETQPVDVPEARCAVRGHVPGKRVTLESVRTVAAYANAYTLAPGTGTSREDEMLSAFDLTPVRVTARSGEVPADIRRGVLQSMLGLWPDTGPPPEDGPHRIRLRNDTDEDHQYVVYRAGQLRRGTWASKLCGAPYNDGTRVERVAGRFSTRTRGLGEVRTYVCGSGPKDDAERAASRVCGA